jgi:hypothetical protein
VLVPDPVPLAVGPRRWMPGGARVETVSELETVSRTGREGSACAVIPVFMGSVGLDGPAQRLRLAWADADLLCMSQEVRPAASDAKDCHLQARALRSANGVPATVTDDAVIGRIARALVRHETPSEGGWGPCPGTPPCRLPTRSLPGPAITRRGHVGVNALCSASVSIAGWPESQTREVRGREAARSQTEHSKELGCVVEEEDQRQTKSGTCRLGKGLLVWSGQSRSMPGPASFQKRRRTRRTGRLEVQVTPHPRKSHEGRGRDFRVELRMKLRAANAGQG